MSLFVAEINTAKDQAVEAALENINAALAVSWIVLVPAEMLGVDSGLGYSILNSRDQLAYDQLAAIMLTIGVLGFAIDWIAQKLFAIWSQSK